MLAKPERPLPEKEFPEIPSPEQEVSEVAPKPISQETSLAPQVEQATKVIRPTPEILEPIPAMAMAEQIERQKAGNEIDLITQAGSETKLEAPQAVEDAIIRALDPKNAR